jgi:hypothetical protein
LLRLITLALMAAALIVAPTTSAQRQSGLVNINVSDNVVQVPVAIAANICDVTVAVLVADLRDGSATCTALAESDATVTPREGRGGETRQEGLINVNLENNQVQVPIAAAANICDVSVLVLATEILLSDATECDANAGAEGIS